MSVVQDARSKVLAKLDELEKREKVVLVELEKENRFFAEAWKEYGSELAGSSDGQQRLRGELIKIRRLRGALESYTMGVFHMSNTPGEGFKKVVECYKNKIQKFEKILEDVQLVQSVLES